MADVSARQRSTTTTDDQSGSGHDEGTGHEMKMYARFFAMILTAMVVMYGLTYTNTYAADHVRWSEERAFMVLIMGGCMALIMLAFMIGMFKNRKVNTAIVVVALVAIGIGVFLVRTEATVQDRSYMSAMIPHHSIAILTSENSEIEDVRVCELAVSIIDAQRREIAEMKWLIDDIGANGPATTAEAAEQRAVPDFEGGSIRTCPGG
jgi:Domain of unknown function (DUF305)